jgi:hypothetical protein
MFGEWIVESIVFERKRLVERRNLIDEGEYGQKHAIGSSLALVELGRRSCDAEGAAIHYDEVVANISIPN